MSWRRLYDAHCWTNRNEGIPRWDRNWPIAADCLAEDIRQATALVGPASLHCIGMPMLTSGWFTKAVERIGLTDQPVPDEQFLAECRALMEQVGMA